VTYPLVYDHGWQIDFAELRARVTRGRKRLRWCIRTIPRDTSRRRRSGESWSGSAQSTGCADVDEVFLDYAMSGLKLGACERDSFGADVCAERDQQDCGAAADEGGLDCGFRAASGVEGGAGRLEVVADTFLSMNTPVQCALPAWLAGAEGMQEQIRARTQGNLAVWISCCYRIGLWRGWRWRRGGMRCCGYRRWGATRSGRAAGGGAGRERCIPDTSWVRRGWVAGGEFADAGGGVRRAWRGFAECL